MYDLHQSLASLDRHRHTNGSHQNDFWLRVQDQAEIYAKLSLDPIRVSLERALEAILKSVTK